MADDTTGDTATCSLPRCDRPARAGLKTCRECAAKNKLAVLETRARRAERGLCPRCGRNPPIPGRSRCEACREYERDRNARRNATTGQPVTGA